MTDEDREAFRRINENLNRLRAAAPRHRMPPALPMSLAPRDGTPVLVCAVDYPGRKAAWTQAYYSRATKRWYTTYAKRLIPNPLGWLPLPEVLTVPVEEMPPVPQAPIVPIGVHKPLPTPEDNE